MDSAKQPELASIDFTKLGDSIPIEENSEYRDTFVPYRIRTSALKNMQVPVALAGSLNENFYRMQYDVPQGSFRALDDQYIFADPDRSIVFNYRENRIRFESYLARLLNQHASNNEINILFREVETQTRGRDYEDSIRIPRRVR